MNPGVANIKTSAPFSISVQSAGRAVVSGVLNASTACLFTAVVGELSNDTVIIDVRHLIAADEHGVTVVAAEDALRRARSGRLVLVGSPPWLKLTLREAGQQHLLPLIRMPAAYRLDQVRGELAGAAGR